MAVTRGRCCGSVLRLGVADEGLVCSTQGDGLTQEIVESLVQSIGDILVILAGTPKWFLT